MCVEQITLKNILYEAATRESSIDTKLISDRIDLEFTTSLGDT